LLPVANHLPSGEKATALTIPVWSVKLFRRSRRGKSQTITCWSSPPETSKRPSGEKTARRTAAVCPSRNTRSSQISLTERKAAMTATVTAAATASALNPITLLAVLFSSRRFSLSRSSSISPAEA
jgi:hypothetical protein